MKFATLKQGFRLVWAGRAWASMPAARAQTMAPRSQPESAWRIAPRDKIAGADGSGAGAVAGGRQMLEESAPHVKRFAGAVQWQVPLGAARESTPGLPSAHAPLKRAGLALPVICLYTASNVQPPHDFSRPCAAAQDGQQNPPQKCPVPLQRLRVAANNAAKRLAADKKNPDRVGIICRGAQERTRTSTVLPPLGPEPSASTNSATWAAKARIY